VQVDLKINTKVGGVKRRGGGGGFGEGYRWVPSPFPTRPFHSEITLVTPFWFRVMPSLVLLTVLMVLHSRTITARQRVTFPSKGGDSFGPAARPWCGL
jgi:hypothetical protein